MMPMVQYISEPFPDAEISGYTSPGWYFWDEAQSHCYGPYESQGQAESALEQYASSL